MLSTLAVAEVSTGPARVGDVAVVGVDGAPGGWLAVELVDREMVATRVFRHFAEVVDEYAPRAAVIAVDMPIGLTEGRRPADVAAREFLGARRFSVFDSPPLWAMDASTYAEARAVRPIGARGMSAQTFALVRKIKEVEAARAGGAPIREVHPEVSFRAMKGLPLAWPKSTIEGREERLALLDQVGLSPASAVPRGATMVDVIDATAAAWSAHRIASGAAQSLPAGTPVEAVGTIVY